MANHPLALSSASPGGHQGFDCQLFKQQLSFRAAFKRFISPDAERCGVLRGGYARRLHPGCEGLDVRSLTGHRPYGSCKQHILFGYSGSDPILYVPFADQDVGYDQIIRVLGAFVGHHLSHGLLPVYGQLCEL